MTHHLRLPKNAIAPRVGAVILLAVHATFVVLLTIKMAGGDGTWTTALVWGANILCAWHRMWQLDWLSQVKRAEVKQADTPNPIDPKLFMPYSTCPSCGTEALHWIESPEVTDFPAYFKRVCEFNNIDMDAIRHLDVEQTAREWAVKRAQNSDVIRECRECNHTWGQKVGVQ